jgi:hypothetical protein
VTEGSDTVTPFGWIVLLFALIGFMFVLYTLVGMGAAAWEILADRRAERRYRRRYRRMAR